MSKNCEIRFVLVIAWVAVKFGINITSVVLEMGRNLQFPIQQEWYLPQISLLPMLFPVNTILAAYTHAVH